MDRRSSHVLEQRLIELRDAVDFPAAPDYGGIVATRLRHEAATRRQPVGDIRRRGVVLAAAAWVLVVFATLLALVPTARRAVADWLGIPGIEIRVEEGPGSTEPTPAFGPLDLGRKTDLAEARTVLGFPLKLPTVAEAPEVYVSAAPAGGALNLAYPPSDQLPEVGETSVGLLVTQFEADLERPLINKVVGQGSTVAPVEIGEEGYWIRGEPHVLLYLDDQGNIIEDTTRLAANVLVWEEDGVSYRIESDLSLPDALDVAESMR